MKRKTFKIGSPISAPWCARVADILREWRKTPYLEGSATRKRGADCVGFVVSVLDELHRYNRQPIPRTAAQDAGLHGDEPGRLAMFELVKRYPHVRITAEDDKPIECGDAVVVRTGVGPGHVLIADANPAVLWHCVRPAGVVPAAAFDFIDKIDSVFRSTEREKWA